MHKTSKDTPRTIIC